jgi:WD40 repeat protein
VHWDVASGNELFVLDGHDGPIFSVATTEFHGHQILATASADKSVRLWDLATGEELAVVHTDAIAAAVSFDAMAKLLIVADSTRLADKPAGKVMIWELKRLVARLVE